MKEKVKDRYLTKEDIIYISGWLVLNVERIVKENNCGEEIINGKNEKDTYEIKILTNEVDDDMSGFSMVIIPKTENGLYTVSRMLIDIILPDGFHFKYEPGINTIDNSFGFSYYITTESEATI